MEFLIRYSVFIHSSNFYDSKYCYASIFLNFNLILTQLFDGFGLLSREKARVQVSAIRLKKIESALKMMPACEI